VQRVPVLTSASSTGGSQIPRTGVRPRAFQQPEPLCISVLDEQGIALAGRGYDEPENSVPGSRLSVAGMDGEPLASSDLGPVAPVGVRRIVWSTAAFSGHRNG
jgi:hypothetical protein